jgi:hypothetical protein
MMKAFNVINGELVAVVTSAGFDMTATGLELAFPHGKVYRWVSSLPIDFIPWRVLVRKFHKHGRDYYGTLMPIKEVDLPEVVRLAHMVS